ncbi:MAG: AAA family ATPase [Muribaculaceae bacterium]|nr:AAA family ATPase [Muribaculaceae bacterium]
MRLVTPFPHTLATDVKTVGVNTTLPLAGLGKIISVKILCRFVLRKWWIPLAGMIAGGTIGFILGKLQSSEVRRAIKVMVIPDRNETSSPPDLLGSLGGIQKFNYDNDIAILKSTTLMREVVEELDLQGLLYDCNGWPKTLIYDHNKLLTAKVTGNMFIRSFRIRFSSGLHSGLLEIRGDTEGKTKSSKIELGNKDSGDTIAVDGGSIILNLTVEGDRIRNGKFEYEYMTVPERSSQLLKGLTIIKSQDKSRIITLEYTSQSYLLNDRLLMTLYELYNNYNQSQKTRRLFEKEKFFLSRVEKVEYELQKIDSILSSLLILNPYAAAYLELGSNLINEELQSRNLVIESDKLSSRIEQALINIYELTPEEPISYSLTELRPVVGEIINEHNYLIERRAQLIEESSEVSPIVTDLDESIRRRREAIINYLETLRWELPLSLSVSRQYNEEIDSMLQRLPDDFTKVTHIRRQQVIKENIYQQLLKQREETALLINDVSDRMELVELPYNTALAKIDIELAVFLGMILGTVGGIIIIVGMVTISKKIVSHHQLKSLGLPIIGEVSKAKVLDEGTIMKMKKYESHYNKNKYDEKTVEEFRLIRSNLMRGKKIGNYKATIMVTSIDQSCGKTFVALQLARSFTKIGKRVLLIDLNFRSMNGLSEALLWPRYGITQLLLQPILSFKDFNLACRKIDNMLSVIPIGNFKNLALDLLGNERLENIIDTYHEEYDVIVLDTVAADIYADARLIGRCADHKVIVIKTGQTEQNKLNEVMARCTEEEYRKSCIIINCFDDIYY